MLLTLLLLFAAAPPEARLLDDAFDVPAHQYRYIPVRIANWPATLDLSYTVKTGAPVRVELVASRDLNLLVRGKPYEFLIRLSSRAASQFQQPVPDKGDYDIVLINERSQASAVNVSAAVRFAREPDVARYVSPQRRLVVITLSLTVFLIGLLWSGLTLLRAMRTARE